MVICIDQESNPELGHTMGVILQIGMGRPNVIVDSYFNSFQTASSFIGIPSFLELTFELTDACFIAELELRKNTHFTHGSSLRISIFLFPRSTQTLTHNQGDST